MSGDNPYGFEPWVDARANGPQTPVLPSPRTPLDDRRSLRFLGPPVRVRRGPRRGFVLLMAVLVAVVCRRRWTLVERHADGARSARRRTRRQPTPLVDAAARDAPVDGEPRVRRHAAGRRRARRVEPVPAHPLRRAAAGRPGERCRADRDGRRPHLGRLGLQFVDDGFTRRGPQHRARRVRARAATGSAGRPCSSRGRRPRRRRALAGDTIGIGGAAPVTRAGLSVYVTGSVTLDGPGHGRAARRAERHRPTRTA